MFIEILLKKSMGTSMAPKSFFWKKEKKRNNYFPSSRSHARIFLLTWPYSFSFPAIELCNMSIENSSFFFIEKYIIKCIFWILILKIQFYFIWMEDSSFHLIWKTCVSAIIMYKPSFVYNHDIHFFDKMSVYNCHFLLIIRHNSTAKINTAVKFMNNTWFTFCFLSKNL